MKIWIFNHHAQGPDKPGGTRHYDLAKHLIARGHQVVIFAAGFHYTLLKETIKYNSDGYHIQEIDGIKFIWVKTIPYKRNNIKRMFNILSYAWRLKKLIPKINLETPDIVIGTTVHPFAPVIAQYYARKYQVPFVFEIRDLWPQSFIDMGVWKQHSMVTRLFKGIEAYTVKRADSIIILSPKTEEYLKKEYDYHAPLYLPNSVDIAYVQKQKSVLDDHPTLNALNRLKEQNRFLCLFTGAIVQSNAIHLFVETAKRLQESPIHIVLVGKGQEREKYEERIRQEKLQNISFLDPVGKKLVPKLLDHADVLLLVQGKIQWGSSNKLYDYLMAGKPIITSLHVRHNDIVEKIGAGFSSLQSNNGDMANKILQLYKMDPEKRKKMGEKARDYVVANHDTRLMALKLEKHLAQLSHHGEEPL